ncbi:MAG: gluconokinase [Hyphomicrobiaceae bacterium]|nr:gluconokinase [Hyphomicrobiaceae bacterium]
MSGATPIVVLMGVSGSGKSTIGAALSAALGWPFRDADSFHPPANVAKMSRGEPLTDADRAPWLAAIAQWIDARQAAGEPAIVSCSALKRRYRDVVVGSRGGVRLVHLAGTRAVIEARMATRRDHFMPLSLLRSQFETLEPPAPEERALVIDVGGSPEAIVAAIRAQVPDRSREA